MMEEINSWRAHWRSDVPASVVVFLVALPLCMGIAIASGVPPAMGLITGIVGGLVVGFLAGSPLQVSGPAAGLSVMVYEMVNAYGLASLGIIVLIAGIAQILAGVLKLGQWFRAVAPAIIYGMLAGIGVLIFASQFHVMIDDSPRGSGLENLIYIPDAIMKGFIPADGSPHFQAAMLGLLTLALVSLWKPLTPKALHKLPAPLAAVTIATIAASLTGAEVVRVDVPSNLLNAITAPTLAPAVEAGWGAILVAGFGMAFVASAETLLCATAVDKLHDGPRTQYNKELLAQGVGNTICGLLGALPMTGVIVRSSANVESGAKTRLSAILHGVWLLLFIAALPFVLRQIPVSVLAAILVYTGYKLVNPVAIRGLAKVGGAEVVIYVATVATIVAVDLLTGVLVGIGMSLAKLFYDVSHLEIDVRTDEANGRTDMYLHGSATVVRLPRLAAALERVPDSTELHVHMEDLDFIDHACFELLTNWEKQHEVTGGKLFIDWESLQAQFRERRPRTVRKARAGGA